LLSDEAGLYVIVARQVDPALSRRAVAARAGRVHVPRVGGHRIVLDQIGQIDVGPGGRGRRPIGRAAAGEHQEYEKRAQCHTTCPRVIDPLRHATSIGQTGALTAFLSRRSYFERPVRVEALGPSLHATSHHSEMGRGGGLERSRARPRDVILRGS
jgi:hypothetical protein